MFGSPFGSFGRGMDPNTPGFILESLPPKAKAIKYIELLLPEGDQDRVLMGEPGLINNSYMGQLMDCTSTDLEWFSAFIGLNNIAVRDPKIVQDEFLAAPKAIKSVARWMYKTPFIGPMNQIPDDRPWMTPQTLPVYYKVMQDGVMGLLAKMVTTGNSQQFIAHFSKQKYLKQAIDRLIIFLNKNTTSPSLKDLSLSILSALSSSPPAVEVICSNPLSLSSLSSLLPFLNSSNTKVVEGIISAIKNSTKNSDSNNNNVAPSPATETKLKKDNEKNNIKECAQCKVTDVPLRICSRCKSVRYCGPEHQKQHWPSHKPSCVAK